MSWSSTASTATGARSEVMEISKSAAALKRAAEQQMILLTAHVAEVVRRQSADAAQAVLAVQRLEARAALEREAAEAERILASHALNSVLCERDTALALLKEERRSSQAAAEAAEALSLQMEAAKRALVVQCVVAEEARTLASAAAEQELAVQQHAAAAAAASTVSSFEFRLAEDARESASTITAATAAAAAASSELALMRIDLNNAVRAVQQMRGERLSDLTLFDLRALLSLLEKSSWLVRAAVLAAEVEWRSRTDAFCPVCMERPRDTALMPCGHCMCGECAVRVLACPFCRLQVADRSRVFL